MFEIVDHEQDIADRTRVRVLINDQVVMFKFQDEPTYEEIQLEAARYQAAMDNQNASTDTE